MQIINPAVPFTFIYPTANQISGLHVLASIYDVSTGVAVFNGDVVMNELEGGVYGGQYAGVQGKAYLVIALVYTDNTYAVINANYPPVSDTYKAIDALPSLLDFEYGSFFGDTSLFVAANVYGNTGFLAQIPMAHVLGGVYFGTYTGIAGAAYSAVKLVYTDNTYSTVDPNYPPGSGAFSCVVPYTTINILGQAILTGQLLSDNKFFITQGDTANIGITATNNGVPIDLTGAVFTTYIRSFNAAILTLPNSQHMANPDQVQYRGQYTLSMSSDDTMQIPARLQQEIITKIVIGSSIVYYHGFNALNTFSPTPT